MAVKKAGRPREGEEVKLSPLNMRTTPELRAMIEAAARRNARSLTQEVEFRLKQSFRDDEVLSALARIEAKLG